MHQERYVHPLLTIAIPTWNRSSFLQMNLEQLTSQIPSESKNIEILISDNFSTDETPEIVKQYIVKGLPIRSIRNHENIGSDCNIAQCFNEAEGRYVLILGDDDLLVDGALELLLPLLEKNQYGVLVMRPYGYDDDFREEYPGGRPRIREYMDLGDFVVAMGAFSTLISAMVISKELLSDVDARKFCGSNLVQTHLAYRAAIKARLNVCIEQYLVACKRNNSSGYAFSQVFVDYFGAILDEVQDLGLSKEAITRLEQRLLIGFYPYYILRQRLWGGEDLQLAFIRYRTRYGGRWSFQLFVAPILRLPRPLALVWGAVAVMAGRLAIGDAVRGFSFAWQRIKRWGRR